jgi:putative SOS response-associated peptidase YedK
MCGRMTLTKRELMEIADELAAFFDPETAELYRARYNVAPTDPHPVLRTVSGRRKLEVARWGFVAPKNKKPLINARAETVPVRGPFSAAYRDGRCVVPADGFYEWKETAEGRQPIWFHRTDGKLLLLAGLHESGRFTVITTTPNALVQPVHDRMPAILSPEEAETWLATPTQEVLHPAPLGVLEARAVSTRVNSVKNDDPECLAAPAGPKQLSLV